MSELSAHPTSANSVVDGVLSRNEFAADMAAAFLPFIDTDRGEIFPQESVTWDYKQEWPFSFSDDYFGGLVRLICAFRNTLGGIIFFGIHDKKRTAGHNRVRIDIERLNNFLRLHLSSPIECKLSTFTADKAGGDVSALLVPRRTIASLPVWCTKQIGKYKPETIWIRQGHEVLEATSKNLALLITGDMVSNFDDHSQSVLSAIPPSPAVVKRFVGRMPTLIHLFRWLLDTDEPRSFLYGKGGSGKTTIAYELSRFLALHGEKLPLYGGHRVQQVVFLSAKEQKLNTYDATIERDSGLDFSNEREMYAAILQLTEWRDLDFINSASTECLKKDVADIVSSLTTVLVIDDVDTLTTKGKDAGFEYLFKILSRTNIGSRVLYTLRNAPSQSLANSIEVPGLSPDGEYQEFVLECCNQFKVPTPSSNLRDDALAIASERRPLVVESIVGLRRTCDSYERALDIFEKTGGQNIRNYIFQREWNALPSDNRARHLLCALALLDKATGFDDLLSILQFDEVILRDAIGSVTEMFLSLDHRGETTNYSVAALTKGFILREGPNLDRFGLVKARVDFYRKSHYPNSPEISRLEISTERLLKHTDGAELAWPSLNESLLPRITQDPRFQALKGKVACRFPVPRLTEAREAFNYCFSMKYEPDITTIRLYLDVERKSGIGAEQCIRICEYICGGKTYSNLVKGEFWSRKGSFLYHKGTEALTVNPSDSFGYFSKALQCNVRALFISANCNDYQTDLVAKNVRNTCYTCINASFQMRQYDEFLSALASLNVNEEIAVDPITVPVEEFVLRVSSLQIEKSAKARLIGKLKSIVQQLCKTDSIFIETENQKQLSSLVSKLRMD